MGEEEGRRAWRSGRWRGRGERSRELKQSLKSVLDTLPDSLSLNAAQNQISGLVHQLDKLGPVNLAAIDEFEQAKERSDYLNNQLEDLTKALNTLEGAIRKIDSETKTRFKATFDQVNNDFAELFPKVFGGGRAYLELTSDDLLESGVSIMAQPPGKKNSTIHLLSGGEKALSALSLVFSIFRLNPAPFCMLDEVDAPLDDANVVRFCRLVEEMSQGQLKVKVYGAGEYVQAMEVFDAVSAGAVEMGHGGAYYSPDYTRCARCAA